MLRSLTLVIAAALAVLPSVAAAQDTLKWETDLATAQRIAGQTNRLVLVHFWGTWCPPCMEMEKTVFSKPGLGTALHPYYVPVKIQVEDDLNQNLVKQFQVEAFPSDIVMTPEGRIVARSKGFKPADQYVGMLNQMAQQARGQMNPTAPQAVAAGAGQPTAANAGGPAAAA
ncbi:MAG: thioredoxin family protein, partial [Planctomycetaceae bacterium]|nr:thioredoxin family protein [Planctomycetaceae bacterium]